MISTSESAGRRNTVRSYETRDDGHCLLLVLFVRLGRDRYGTEREEAPPAKKSKHSSSDKHSKHGSPSKDKHRSSSK